MPRSLTLALLTAAVLTGAAASAHASRIKVNTTADDTTAGDGHCSLRKAIEAVDSPGSASGDCAAAAFGANTIVLPKGTYNLEPFTNPAELLVGSTVSSLTIEGAGVGATTINGMGDTRVFEVAAGATVSIEELTISGGQALAGSSGVNGGSSGGSGGAGGAGADGGGILNRGTLALDGVAVTGDQAGAGGRGGSGGLDTAGAGGTGGAGGSGGDGGGIYNTGTLTLTGVTIAHNQAGTGGEAGVGGLGGTTGGPGGAGGAGGAGGGIFNAGGSVVMTGSTLAADVAGDGGAGGLGSGPASSTSGPGGPGGEGGAGGGGGGVWSSGGTVSVTNTTLASNLAGDGAAGGSGSSTSIGGPGGAGGQGGPGGGGGAVGVSGTVQASLLNVTVAGNRAGDAGAPGSAGTGSTAGTAGSVGTAGTGGGVYDTSPGGIYAIGSLGLQGTLLASNAGGNCSAPSLIDAGHNLSFGDSTCPPAFSTGDPQLGALQDNGGPTQTIDLGTGSAALDQIPRSGAGCPATDQRGAPRPGGTACDIGAYEVVAPLVITGAPTLITARSVTIAGTATAFAGHGGGLVNLRYGTTKAVGSASARGVGVGGVSPTPVSVAVSGLRPDTKYTYRLVISTADGTTFGQERTFSTVVPALGQLAISPATLPRGGAATVSYRDSEAALTTFTVLRCAARRGRGCARYASVRSFVRRDHAGRDQFRLQGGPLRKGVYMLQATPRVGVAIGATLSVSFGIAG